MLLYICLHCLAVESYKDTPQIIYTVSLSLDTDKQEDGRLTEFGSSHQHRGYIPNKLSTKKVVLSAGDRFLSGAAAGYITKRLLKLATSVIRLIVFGPSYLSYK